jgi:uncharacterized membrane protein YfcA
MKIVYILNAGIILFTLVYAIYAIKDISKEKLSDKSWFGLSIMGIVTEFFDTLGIGTYAPQTAFFKFTKWVPDRIIPGTLNTCCILPMCAEAVIYITTIKVEPITLIVTIATATLGAILGAGIVAKLPEKPIQLGMGIALLLVAFTITSGQLGLMPVGGTASALTGSKLIIAAIGCFIIGGLMTIGMGGYAPMMALVYSLGMNPRLSFPIMMGACAYLIPAAGIRFIKEGAYDVKTNIAVNIFGLIGVAAAAYIVKTIPLYALKWLIVAVVLYTSITMLRSFSKKSTIKDGIKGPITTD